MTIQSQPRVFADARSLYPVLANLRAQGRTIVTTNGCFDILHAGHVQYLDEAARQGDVLVVGINSDAVVRALKGPGRPLQCETDRVALIASLRVVDYAFIFREEDPRAFLEILRPDVHVKGGDYSRDLIERQVVERNGGRIAIVSFVQGRSTTRLVEKIREQSAP